MTSSILSFGKKQTSKALLTACCALVFLIAGISNCAFAQNVFSGEGVNWVGSINGYSQPTNLSSDYRVLTYRKVSTTASNPTDGRGQWTNTVNVQSSGGNVTPANMSGGGSNGFLFTSGPSGNQYANKWNFSGVGQGALDAVNGVQYINSGSCGGSCGQDMGLNMSTTGYYTFVMKDAGYAVTGFYVGYTSTAPVTITHSPSTQLAVLGDRSAQVSFTLSGTPSAQEKFYVRYRATTNDFSSTANVVQATVSGTTATATIPTQASGTVVYYYVFSSTMSLASITGGAAGDIAYEALKYADNSGANYSYTANPIQVTSSGGTSTAATYTSLASALTAINGGTIHTGTITCKVGAGYTETAPAGGFTITQYTSNTAATPVTFVKSGTGTNPTFTAFTPQTAGNLNDAIFKLIGNDYITIDGFTMQENSLNTTTTAASNNMTEFGVALFYTTTTNGAQNNTIQNCTISLNRSYSNTFGIYSNSRTSATAVTTSAEATTSGGSNSNNKMYGNTISNVDYGIVFIGSSTAAAMDAGNDIGGTASNTGNTITNWGGQVSGALSGYISLTGSNYCVFMNHQINENVSYNTITSATNITTLTTTTFGGILKNYSTTSPTSGTSNVATYNNNTVTLSNAPTTAQMVGISAQASASVANSSATISTNNNNIVDCAITGASATTASFLGIFNSYAPGTMNITGNTIRGITSTVSGAGSITGIQQQTNGVVTALNINNNKLGDATSGFLTYSAANSATVTGIAVTSTGAASTCALTITGNDFRGIVHSSTGSGAHTYITNGAATVSQNISSNTFTNLNVNTTGSVTFVSNAVSLTSSGSMSINSNSIVTAFNKGGAGGTVTFFNSNASSVSGSTVSMTNNNFSNITVTGATGFVGINNTDGTSSSNCPAKTVTGNTFSSISGGTGSINPMTVSLYAGTISSVSSNTVSGITWGAAVTAITIGSGTSTTLNANSNTISSLSSTAGAVIGLSVASNSTTTNIGSNTINTLSSTASGTLIGLSYSGTTVANIFKNKIYDISGSNAGTVINGIAISAGTTVNTYNNLVGDLRATAATATAPTSAIIGINLTSTTTSSSQNVYYNSLYLNATSTGTNFGTAGILHTTSSTATTAALSLRNNIIVNTSTATGTGKSVAYQRSSTTLTNYATTSNNNNLYGTTGLFYDGTNTYSTLAAYKTAMSTRDAASINENATWQSTTGSSANFLKFSTSVSTGMESGAANISTYTDDYIGTIRQGNSGYVTCGSPANTGTAPDMGAWELCATPLPQCSGTPASSTITGGTTPICSGASGGTLTLSTTYTDLGITYQWKSSTTSGGPYNTTLGTSASQSAGTLTQTTYFICVITCSNSGLFYTTAEKAIVVNALPTVVVTPSATTYCTPGGTAITLTASGASTYTWSGTGTPNLSATSGNPITATPSTATTITATGTDANGCVNTGTAALTVATSVVMSSVTATPSSVCTNGSSSLLASAYVNSTTASTYAFTASSGTFTPLSGGTNVSAIQADDAISGAIPIGFNFSYLGNTYTNVYASSNGFLSFNSSISSTATNSLSAPVSTIIPLLAPLWDDLSGATTGTASYLTTGTSGSKVFTMEWLNWKWNYQATAAVISFQVKLYEADGHIEFVYRQDATAYNAGTTGGASIGIAGLTVGNYLSLNGTGTSPTASNSTETSSLATKPATGQVYTFSKPAPSTFSWSPSTYLSSASVANPTASNIAADITYTATASQAGCSATSTASITVVSNANITAQPSSLIKCNGASAAFSVTATGPSLTYQWRKDGNNISGATSSSYNIPAVSAGDAGSYDVVVQATCGSAVTSNAATLTVNALPTVSVSPTSATYCTGGSAITLTASGASTYTWAGTGTPGLSATSGNPITSTPSTNTTITVTGTDANNCVNTATSTIIYTITPTGVTASASPASICTGSTSSLTSEAGLPGTANNYVFSTSTGASLDPMTGAATVVSSSTDDAPMNTSAGANTTAGASVALPFTFNFDNANYTHFSASPDGWMVLKTSTAAAAAEFTNVVTSSTNAPRIFPYWDDLATGTTGSVKTVTIGTTPNRIFIVQWNVTIPRNTTGAANSTFQAWLYETSNKVEFRYGTMGTATGTVSSGISGSTGANFQSITFSSNTASNSAANDAQVPGALPASGRSYTFKRPITGITFAWSPSGDVVSPSSQNTPTNALSADETFTIMASNGTCSATASTTVTVVSNANITAQPQSLIKCNGASATFSVTATGPGLTYQWRKGGNNISGATSGSYTIPAVSSTDAGSYDVVVSATCGSPVISSAATLTVNSIPTATASSNSPVCVGSTLNLTGATDIGTSFSWTGPNSFSSASQSPSISNVTSAAAGTYSFTATANGCTSTTATTTVVVNPTPSAVTVTPSLPSLCSGASVTLTASGGTSPAVFNASSGTINLSIPDNSATGVSSALSVSGVPAGATIDSVIVTFNLSHAFSGDAEVNLQAPNGQIINLMADRGSSSTAGFVNTRVTSDGTKPAFSTGANPFTGTFKADATAQSTLIGSPAVTTQTFSSLFSTINGNWTIRAYDDASSDVGTLNNWSIKIAYSYASFIWTPSTGLNTTTGAIVTASPTATTTYTATSTVNGCTSSGTSTVTVLSNYTITASAGTGGSISPSGATSVCSGNNQGYTITPNACYSIADVLVDGVSQGAVSSYTFNNVTAAHTISASFVLNTYAITVTQGAHGTIAPGTGNVNCGSNATYTITPDACYSIADVVVDGSSVGAVSSYTFNNVTATHTLTASYVLNTYALTVTQGAHGTIAPGTGSVNCGFNATYSITPNFCYSIADVVVDGISQGAVSSYTFTNVNAAHSISATFVLNTYNITVSSGAHGSITPGTGSVNCGSNATYTITPNDCYSIADVVVDGVSQGAVSSYTFTNVTAAHSISATFVLNTYTITVSAGTGGSIAPGTGSVNCGSNATYTVTPDVNYSISDVIVDGVSQGAISSYTFTNVIASHTISATFVQNASAPPVITGTYCPGATSVTGTSTEADGTTIEVFVNNAAAGTTTVASGGWSETTPALSAGDVITATATAPGKTVSIASGAVTVQSSSASPVITGTYCPGATSVSGTSTEGDGTTIEVFINNISAGTTTVSSGGWTTSVSSLLAGDAMTATATAAGKCVSAVSSQVTVNTPPTLTTTSVVSCNGTDANLVSGITSSTSGLTITYYSDAALSMSISSTVTSTGTYYVKADDGTCTSSASIMVTISTPPTVTTQSINKGCDASNTNLNDGITNDMTGLTVTFYSDNAHTSSISNVVNAPGTYYASVTNGYCATDVSIAVIGDVTPPSITCPGSVTENLSTSNPATCSRTVTLGTPVYGDDCSGALALTWNFDGATDGSGTGPVPAGQLFHAGRTKINYTVTDAAGNSTTCNSTIVTIVDDILPVITNPPANTTIGPDAGECTATVNFPTIDVSDNCGIKTVRWILSGSTVGSGDWQAGASIPQTLKAGITRVKYSVYDTYGNPVFYTYEITVADNTPPAVHTPNDITANLTSGCSMNITVPNLDYSDVCSGVASVSWTMTGATAGHSRTTGINLVGQKVFNGGVTTITYRVKDGLGNTTIASFTVTVIDNIDPTITCPSNISDFASATACNKKIAVPAAVVSDNCKVTLLTWTTTGATTLSSPATGVNQIGSKVFNGGMTTVTYTVGDAAGNTAQCSFTVTVTDNTPPAITCPVSKAYSITSGTDCFKSIAVNNPTVTENCTLSKLTWVMSGVTIDNSAASGVNYVGTHSFNLGVTTIAYTATDASGNSSTCSFTVTVTDGVKPTIACGSAITQTTTTGCNMVVSIDDKTASDNCSGVASLTWVMTGATTDQSNNTGTNQVGSHSFNVGVTTITYTATDGAGNVGICKQTVTVKEPVKPSLSGCPSPFASCKTSDNTYTIPATLSGSDNCTPASALTVTYAVTGATTRNGTGYNASGLFNVGVSTVKWTVKDASGNASTCTMTVTISSTPCGGVTRGVPVTQTTEANSTLKASLYPNPTTAQFALQVTGKTREAVEVSVYNAKGQKVESLKAAAGETLHFGEGYYAGSYMIEVKQGSEKVTVTGVKSN